MVILIYFDGACEPRNPGGLGTFGFIIRDLPGLEPVMGCGVLGDGPAMTNNVAEYAALGKALRWLSDNARGALAASDELVISGDSKLVCEQLAGKWACNAAGLKPLLARCKELLAGLGCRWSTRWMSRDENTAADSLTRAAFVGHTGKPFPVRPKK